MRGEVFWERFPPSREGQQEGIVSSSPGCYWLQRRNLETAATSFSRGATLRTMCTSWEWASRTDGKCCWNNQPLSRHPLNEIINVPVDQALLSWVFCCLQTKHPNRYTEHLPIYTVSRLIFIEDNFDHATPDQKPSFPPPPQFHTLKINSSRSSFAFQGNLFPVLQSNLTSRCFVHMTCSLLLLHGAPILGSTSLPSVFACWNVISKETCHFMSFPW